MLRKQKQIARPEKFSKMFIKNYHCSSVVQNLQIEGLDSLIDEMDREELNSIMTEDFFDELNELIERKTLSIENAFLLLKQIGYCNVMKELWSNVFCYSLLRERFEKMIVDEEDKRLLKNEKLLIDLCECYLAFCFFLAPTEVLRICVPYLLKVALSKEESEEKQKEVEIALLALSNLNEKMNVERELWQEEAIEIIKYHQKHRNLTHLAYQSAWMFLINRLNEERGFIDSFLSKLNFVSEATRELEELRRCVDWKKKAKRGKEKKELVIIKRWCKTLRAYFEKGGMREKEYVGLSECVVRLYRASKSNYKKISNESANLFYIMVKAENVGMDDLLYGGVVDLVLKETLQTTLENYSAERRLMFFLRLQRRLNGISDEANKGEKLFVTKRKILDRLEEEGYEDAIFGFYGILFYTKCIYLSTNLADFFAK
ncbi:uncharacterized protein MONOS_18365 [Monocercomonoides exilis]|uniref:uncharacterized protein n=1 Tax=Monocercomonoides exilis TaxID=2049356 RepID=UPI00355A4284|nr:hypothetical protein MONOS_18365 [Monocercomonoides exilis]